jgi:hypothetical protein
MCTVGGDVGRIILGTVPVGPIVFTLYAAPILGGTARLDLDAGDVTTRARVTFGAVANLGYTAADGWNATFEPSLTGGAEMETTSPGYVEADARLRIGARIGVAVFDSAGVFADLSANLHASHRSELDQCTWRGSITAGASAAFGGEIRIPLIGVSLGSVTAHEIASVEHEIWTGAGGLPWCTSEPPACAAAALCQDDVRGVSVCDGHTGAVACGEGLALVCTCTAGGWTECGTCEPFNP